MSRPSAKAHALLPLPLIRITQVTNNRPETRWPRRDRHHRNHLLRSPRPRCQVLRPHVGQTGTNSLRTGRPKRSLLLKILQNQMGTINHQDLQQESLTPRPMLPTSPLARRGGRITRTKQHPQEQIRPTQLTAPPTAMALDQRQSRQTGRLL